MLVVPLTGLEPARLTASVPKTDVSSIPPKRHKGNKMTGLEPARFLQHPIWFGRVCQFHHTFVLLLSVSFHTPCSLHPFTGHYSGTVGFTCVVQRGFEPPALLFLKEHGLPSCLPDGTTSEPRYSAPTLFFASELRCLEIRLV